MPHYGFLKCSAASHPELDIENVEIELKKQNSETERTTLIIDRN